jgi:hypothetical protein
MTKLYCCGCSEKVEPILIFGDEAYPHRKDLYNLKFWICEKCLNFVGCHKHGDGDVPLGCIPTKEIKKLRMQIHSLIDPIWKSGKLKRGQIYKIMSDKLGFKYHTASLKTVNECQDALTYAKELQK